MVRFVLVFVLAFCVSLLITFYAQNVIAPIFDQLLAAFIVIALITGTTSYALFAYVDTITKDVAADKTDVDESRVQAVIDKLSDLKREILINAFAVVGLLLLEKLAHGYSLLFPTSEAELFNWHWAVSTSLRMACFASSAVIVAIQFHAFMLASDYRRIMGLGK